MKSALPVFFGLLTASIGAFAQAPDQAAIDKALLASPANMRAAATVIKWKPDFTYETLRKGTNRLVCYDRSGQPGQQPFSVECTSLANLDRAAQNLKLEAIPDKKASLAAFDAAEKDGGGGGGGGGAGALAAVFLRVWGIFLRFIPMAQVFRKVPGRAAR